MSSDATPSSNEPMPPMSVDAQPDHPVKPGLSEAVGFTDGTTIADSDSALVGDAP